MLPLFSSQCVPLSHLIDIYLSGLYFLSRTCFDAQIRRIDNDSVKGNITVVCLRSASAWR